MSTVGASGAIAFRELHHRHGAPILLPNAWDHASAAALAVAGFPAVGTTSLGVAAAAGLPDGAGRTHAETLRLARVLGGGPFLLSVDVEGGFSDNPAEVADLAAELAEAGAVGVNLEDGRADGGLTPPRLHLAKITAVKSAVPWLFVNARTDTHWLGGGHYAETASRLAAYQDAGADGVFVPVLTDPASIAAAVGATALPLNVLATPDGPSLARLAELGVRRVSLGSLLFRLALGAAVDTATSLHTNGVFPQTPSVPGYAAVQALASPRS
ncbi:MULTISPECIES: isocitrate lyase/PEP mutase family protein [Streptomyces]|uniref:Isocitrate lyase/phosphoenolpyruvate mutase family protein n=1 Tax=Streptomyces kasugaensis TaxID=1946 RepID=A0A4Q9I1E3_STRKA|nr:isocitrate lyase/phosphoenolpyruvate mutase family protein [Streptomyces kasugaensis]TBO60729.1 isocitrate lyase/phosphoenolpyruvate mutase family protein [Streptomyces kasugaensis]